MAKTTTIFASKAHQCAFKAHQKGTRMQIGMKKSMMTFFVLNP